MLAIPRLARILFVALTAAAFFPSVAAGTAEESGRSLFSLSRSKNANIVRYDVRVAKSGQLDLEDPMDAYWIMRAEDGRREELSFLEKNLAYGWEVVGRAKQHRFRVRLTAFSDRVLEVNGRNGRYRATTSIDKKAAYLTRVYVKTSESGLVPTVLYVDVFGKDMETGRDVRERLRPN